MADEYRVVVHVGAQLDARSFDTTLGDAAKRAQKAAQAGSRASIAADRERAAAARAVEREIAAENRRQLAEQRAAMRKFNQEWLADKRAAAKEAARIAREQARAEKKARREVEQAEKAAQRERERLAYRTSYRFTRFVFPRPEGMIGYGMRTATGLARGLGMDLSLTSAMSRVRAQEEAAAGIAQQERIATGATRGREFYQQQATTIAGALAIDPEQVSALTRKFTGLTGEFSDAVKMQQELAAIGVASGASLEHVGEAAGNIYNAFRGMPNAGKATIDVLRSVVHQTASGAIEMKDYAVRIGQVAALARRMPGDVTHNITSLSALTQFSILGGGGNINAAQAATSMRGIMTALTQSKRVSAIETLMGGGRRVYNRQGQLNDVMETMISMVAGAKGDARKMAAAIPNVRANAIFQALANTYNQAGGGRGGEAAMRSELGKLMGHPMTREQEKANIDERSRTQVAAQRFQNAMDDAAKTLMARLLPSAEKLAPQFITLATRAGQVAALFTEHWAAGIATAITLVFGRALAESWMRQGIDRLLAGRPTPGGPYGMAGGVLPSAAGTAKAGAAQAAGGVSWVHIANLAAMGTVIGLALGEALVSWRKEQIEKQKGISKDIEGSEGLYGEAAAKKAKELRAKYAEWYEQERYGKTGVEGFDARLSRNVKRFGSKEYESVEADMLALPQMAKILEERAKWSDQSAAGLHFVPSFEKDIKRREQSEAASAQDIGASVANQLRDTQLKVHVANFPPNLGNPPTVSPGGRTPAPGQRPP